MSGEDLIVPGFHGKLPAAGDFVGRRLPAGFVRGWDRWVARHLAARMSDGDALCFLLASAPGPAAGVTVASRDRAGRRFPLTLAVALPAAGLPSPADGWFGRLVAAARAAVDGGWTPEALDRALAGLPLAPSAEGAPGAALLLWTPGAPPCAALPEAPDPVLDLLLVPAKERG